MTYDEGLAQRLREEIGELPGCVEKKMFGGVGFLLNGNMVCGVINADLIIRVGPDQYENALQERHSKQFDITGRPMTGWIIVVPDGYAEDKDLKYWLDRGIEFAKTLPPK